MSGFDIIYVAGVILLLELLFVRLIKLTHLCRQLLAAAKDPLPLAPQLETATDTHSKNVSDLGNP